MKKVILLSTVLGLGALGMACGEAANNANANKPVVPVSSPVTAPPASPVTAPANNANVKPANANTNMKPATNMNTNKPK
jgi:hypothetical protein